jgi:maltose O-acetyltransferase
MDMNMPLNLQGRYEDEVDWLLNHVDEVPSAYQKFLASNYPNSYVRREYLKSLGVIFADDTSFANAGFTVIPNSPSSVHVYVGRHVSIAPNVTCICSSNANNGVEINRYRYVSEVLTREGDIHIGDDSWIGAGAIILPGVSVGNCSVIGAGCVLTRSAEPYGIYAGVPGRKIGDVRQQETGFEQ